MVTLIGIPLGLVNFSGVVSLPPSLAPTFLQLDFSRVFETTALIVIFTLLLVDFFDTAGTLIGVAHRAGCSTRTASCRACARRWSRTRRRPWSARCSAPRTPRAISRARPASSAGGRTGLTGVVVAALFLLALFFSPLAGMIPAYASAAALLYVAVVMARGLAEMDWDDLTESAPAVVAAVSMPLTYSIATGIGLGFITYAVIKLVAGKVGEASPAVLVLAVLFAIKFAVAS